MAKRATIAGLAERAGVSISSIDRILNGRDPGRQATAERVLAAAEGLAFYALPVLRGRLGVGKPMTRQGFMLQQLNRPFYRLMAETLRQAVRDAGPQVEAVIERQDDLAPDSVAARMLSMGERVDALAVVTAEHPRVTQAIETLALQGVPVFGLISGLTAACGVGSVGLDNWKVGRTAGWAVSHLCRAPGKVGILVGNHRYRCQEMNESGFRSYSREHAADFTLLEPLSTFEEKGIAREMTESLLARKLDLVALYLSGRGSPGRWRQSPRRGGSGRSW